MYKYLIIILLQAFLLQNVHAKTSFFIASKSNNEQASVYLLPFESAIYKAIKKAFPCAEILSQSDVLVLLNFERQRQLLNSGDDHFIGKIGESMSSEYLIGISANLTGNMLVLSTFCVNTRTNKVLARGLQTSAPGEAGLDAAEQVSEQLVKGLSNSEICPFVGPISIRVKSELSDKVEESRSVFCNNSEQAYVKTESIDKIENSLWELNKIRKYQVNGTVSYDLFEQNITEEQDGCHACDNGTYNGLVTNYKKTVTAKIDQLSTESRAENNPIDDARAEIKFNDNGTYTLLINAASKKGEMTIVEVKRAEGGCDSEKPVTKRITKKIDVPLSNAIFGPFPGTALDKTLSQKGTIVTTNPVTKEKTSIDFEFHLSRND